MHSPHSLGEGSKREGQGHGEGLELSCISLYKADHLFSRESSSVVIKDQPVVWDGSGTASKVLSERLPRVNQSHRWLHSSGTSQPSSRSKSILDTQLFGDVYKNESFYIQANLPETFERGFQISSWETEFRCLESGSSFHVSFCILPRVC